MISDKIRAVESRLVVAGVVEKTKAGNWCSIKGECEKSCVVVMELFYSLTVQILILLGILYHSFARYCH